MSDSNDGFRFPLRKEADPAPTPREPRFRMGQAHAALLWERLWPALWAPVAIAGAFLALALLNVFLLLPGWLHALVLLLFVAAIGWTGWRGLRAFRLPDEGAARRRLERDSGLPHRPLHTLRDRPAGNDPVATELWRLHQERVRAAMRRLRVAWPQSDGLAAHDRYALRALVVLVLIAAGGASWGDWKPRLSAAVSPHFGGTAAASVAALDLWVTPPEYTGLPPVFLKSANPAHTPNLADPVPVPKGSLVLARVTGGSGTPSLEAGGKPAAFEAVDSSTFQIQQPIDSGTRVAVTQGSNVLGSWNVRVIPDNPPAIAYASPPAKGERGALRLDYTAQDDYGLAEAKAVVRLALPEDEAPALDRSPIELPLALPGVRPREARNAAFHDLTGHPWAGLNVTVRLTALDGAGQTGSTEDVAMVLPERVFNHPVARAIVEERKKLTLRPKQLRIEVARALADISSRPSQFGGDLVAFLALRTAVNRLLLDEEAAAVPAVQQLLWETALRIEDGGLSLAERDLRDAERRLAEALERGADDQELKKLMDELQAALDKFLDAMEQQMREALERGEQIPMVPPEMADRMMDRQDLQEMMDRMRQMAETGARDAARQMLSQLQQMMENMRNGAMAQMQQQGQNEAAQMMRELQELAQRQQNLLDQTFRQSQEQMGQQDGQQQGQGPRNRQGRQQQGQQGQSGSPLMQKQAEQQEALRRQLGELMRRMGEQQGGEIPRPLGRAERAMRDAGQALQQGQPGSAVPPQTQAMDELQQGMQAMAEQMMQQMMGQQGPAMMGQQPGQAQQQRQGQGRNRDPLGRRPSGFGNYDSDDVKIPEEAELQRAREILDELRRRSGQYGRPQMEREYIDRLLKQF
ncbi:TIGR02302 family protein [Roseomonas genomospecies 6]|uniref:TIGR02302 family protein n=1 Tax=Roseomonas genomospecies 6 TaxID=214106 RepID=A0A9W7TY76_9PROT|nr:TIGR02302 family protein [Roseomonas genomospecies 6]KAA0679208.1 TIGR02302 family protein [Roseomonas genomospecies 6]